jgi:hypothetical protein
MKRQRTLMTDTSPLIQHFNPACRASRAYPELAVSRLLMSLNDFDLPIRSLLKGRNFLDRAVEILSTPLVALVHLSEKILPRSLHDTILECVSVFVLHLIIIGLVSLGIHNLTALIVLIAVLAGLLIIRECFTFKRRNKIRSQAILPNDDFDNNELNMSVGADDHSRRRYRKQWFTKDYAKMSNPEAGRNYAPARPHTAELMMDYNTGNRVIDHGLFHDDSAEQWAKQSAESSYNRRGNGTPPRKGPSRQASTPKSEAPTSFMGTPQHPPSPERSQSLSPRSLANKLPPLQQSAYSQRAIGAPSLGSLRGSEVLRSSGTQMERGTGLSIVKMIDEQTNNRWADPTGIQFSPRNIGPTLDNVTNLSVQDFLDRSTVDTDEPGGGSHVIQLRDERPNVNGEDEA